MKNVLILSGSPRLNGNSDLLCNEFMRGVQEAGHKVEKIRVATKKIGYCRACYFCRDHKGQCAVRDDMAEILQKMIDADVIVLSSPVYFYSIDAQLKAVIDQIRGEWPDSLVLDAGANMDCHADWLVQFAIMGSVYSQGVLKRTKPLVGLLSIGTEDCKGNEMTKETFRLLKEVQGIDFRGNVEGHDIFQGQTDVVVCDGFVGNVVLKTSESLAHAVSYFLKRECFRGIFRVLGAVLLKGAFKSLKNQLDPDIYGGAPLLGVPGAVIITHGSSTHKAIYYAVKAGVNAARNDVSGLISSRIEEYESSRKSF